MKWKWLSTFALPAVVVLNASRSQAQMGGPAPVAVAPVVEREIATGKSFVGTVQPVRKSVVGSAVDGRVLEMPVEEGDAVKKGDLLAQLRTKTIEAELSAARSELDLRKQELAELENGTRPEIVQQKQAAMMAADARMSYAKKDLARIQRLYEGQTAANDELDESISRADETQQEFMGAKAAYEEAVAGPRKEVIGQARAQVEQQQHEVERLEDMLSKYSIAAPFDGYVTTKRTEVGEWVMQGQAVAEVIELDLVDVEALVSEEYINRIQLGMPASVVVPSISGRVFEGTVAFVVPQADTQSRSFPVKVRVPNPAESDRPPVLMSGQFANVTFSVGETSRAMLVHKDAIVLGGPSPTVFIFEAKANEPGAGTVKPVVVTLGQPSEGMIEVSGPLQPGQMVVVRGNERLFPGQEVHVQETLGSARESRSGEESGDSH
jgi:RND family efflux transporter MFP subunit